MERSYDFSGWATRNDLKCSDGRTIRRNAFKQNDGAVVPLVWNHQHNEATNVLGHAELENRPEGVYAYCTFNDTDYGRNANELVRHGDITALSIYANQLKQVGGDVIHGAIKEVSLVLAGANPGAYIDSIIEHSDDGDEEAIIYTGEEISLYHSDEQEEETEMERDIQEIFDEMSDEQKDVVYTLVGAAVNGEFDDDGEEDYEDYEDYEEDDDDMKHNLFDSEDQENVLSHSELEAIFSDAKRYGSLKDSVLQHGITEIEQLFPNEHLLNNPPDWIKRPDEWVSKVMNGVHKSPFSRIKSQFADITEDEARAKGYIKGKLKKEEVFGLLKRSTTPTTIYKKQKLDRDDVIDITDFDVVAWLKQEMRMMLDEEIARAILVGDGRQMSSDDKINEQNIRPVWTDASLFTIKAEVPYTVGDSADKLAKATIRAAVKARKNYRGSGNPVFFTTEDVLTDMLLLEDVNGRVIYDTEEKLRSAMRVSSIVTVPVMEGLSRTDSDSGNTMNLLGLIVNLNDYNVGADKGGEVNMFDDFDIDYNAQKYLIETRCSGALIKPYSAIALEYNKAGTSASE